MRKITVHLDTNIVGTHACAFVEVEETLTHEEIDKITWAMAVENAEMYGELVDSDSSLEDLESFLDQYILMEDVEGWWEDYDPEKHDELAVGKVEFIKV